MRESLQKLIQDTLKQKYRLPHKELGINRATISNHNDHVFVCTSSKELVKLIYNSIIDYSFNQFELSQSTYENLLVKALKTKIRYDDKKLDSEKIKYGFFGEVLFHSILCHFFKTNLLISKGCFYNPTSHSETTGYDSYHLTEHKGKVFLWFGEVKFRETLNSCVTSALENLEKTLSDDYLEQNILAMNDHKSHFNLQNSQIEKILDTWDKNPNIELKSEIKKHNLTLTYPILLVFSNKSKSLDKKITSAINSINKYSHNKKFSLSINYKLFFILMPLEEINGIKREVIQWIESKKPLLS